MTPIAARIRAAALGPAPEKGSALLFCWLGTFGEEWDAVWLQLPKGIDSFFSLTNDERRCFLYSVAEALS